MIILLNIIKQNAEFFSWIYYCLPLQYETCFVSMYLEKFKFNFLNGKFSIDTQLYASYFVLCDVYTLWCCLYSDDVYTLWCLYSDVYTLWCCLNSVMLFILCDVVYTLWCCLYSVMLFILCDVVYTLWCLYLQFPKRRWSGASRLGEPHLDGDWYRFGGIFWRLWGGSNKLLPSRLLLLMESIESERSSPATMTAAAAVHSAKRLLTMDLRRSVSALKIFLSNI